MANFQVVSCCIRPACQTMSSQDTLLFSEQDCDIVRPEWMYVMCKSSRYLSVSLISSWGKGEGQSPPRSTAGSSRGILGWTTFLGQATSPAESGHDPTSIHYSGAVAETIISSITQHIYSHQVGDAEGVLTDGSWEHRVFGRLLWLRENSAVSSS